MSSNGKHEIIVVRSLTDSDLGWFAAHRQHARSKQRAININAVVAQQILSPELFANGGSMLDCRCSFRQITDRSLRHFGKVGKNWRLGGNKLEGPDFRLIDSKDFILIRTKAPNDGTYPVSIAFIARAINSEEHIDLVSLVEKVLNRSMAVFAEGTGGYKNLCLLVSPPERRTARKITGGDGGPQTVPPIQQQQSCTAKTKRPIHAKKRSPHLSEQTLRMAFDLSAPAQLLVVDTVSNSRLRSQE